MPSTRPHSRETSISSHSICQNMPMKAVNFKHKGDSGFFTCLLSYLEAYQLQVKKIEKMRSHVYTLHLTNGQIFVLKNFADLKKWNMQKILTAFLKQSGFTTTYEFYTFIPPLNYKDRLYCLIEYIKPHNEKFHFFNHENRKEGLRLLSNFHRASEAITANLSGEVPTFNQIKKWEERLGLFKSFLPVIGHYVSEVILEDWIAWACWSLKGMRKFEHLIRKETNTIIHGDVAHHNFLRRFDGALCLIDFDLVSLAPPIIDYLQYANRILPSVNYDLNALWNYKELKQFQSNPAFLYALAYPTDIFREWNRLNKENLLGSQPHLYSVWKMSVEDFTARMAFNKSVARMVENPNR